MARTARQYLITDDSFAHVISRSIDKIRVFDHAEDFTYFKSLLLSNKREHPFKLFHYCLMNTHFHLVVQVIQMVDFVEALQNIKWKYTQYYNRKRNRVGPLWRERYKSLLIEDDSYMLACGWYVEENPVRAKLVGKAEDWPYSSKLGYLGREDVLVDKFNQVVRLPEIDLNNFDEFEKGQIIGSGWFKYKTARGL